MRALMFSRTYPAYHTKKGQPTEFIEKIWSSGPPIIGHTENLKAEKANFDFMIYQPKIHTIRENENWKKGDLFIPRVWGGKPYHTKTIQFADPIEVTQTYKFEIRGKKYLLKGKSLSLSTLKEVSANDGLQADDFEIWFSKVKAFKGQVICWTNFKY